ncbi:MAG: hypothetical protein R2781_11410 [Flavobacteriaceae bacterium]
MNLKLTLANITFAFIIFLLAAKFTFSYLNVDVVWWLRYLTPNYEKFNPLHLPKNTTEIIEFALLPAMLFYLLISFNKLGILKLPIFLTCIMLLLNGMTAFINDIGILGSIRFTLKISNPIYFFIILLVQANRTGKNHLWLIKWAIVYFLFLSTVALLFFDVSFNRGQERWPVFFSGLHTHNYILAVTFIALSYFLRKHTYILLVYFFITFAFLAFGYAVRTTMVFYFFYMAVILYLKEDFFKNIYAKFIAYTPFLLLFLFSVLRDFDFDRFSSGRLTMYAKKFQILENYQFHEYLFGRGWGSDLVKTVEWWYAEKGSHNDYLTFFIENGVFFLMVFLLLISSLLILSKKNHVVYVALILGYLLTSLISNGFAVRTLASYWFFAVLAFFYIEHKNKTLSFV